MHKMVLKIMRDTCVFDTQNLYAERYITHMLRLNSTISSVEEDRVGGLVADEKVNWAFSLSTQHHPVYCHSQNCLHSTQKLYHFLARIFKLFNIWLNLIYRRYTKKAGRRSNCYEGDLAQLRRIWGESVSLYFCQIYYMYHVFLQ